VTPLHQQEKLLATNVYFMIRLKICVISRIANVAPAEGSLRTRISGFFHQDICLGTMPQKWHPFALFQHINFRVASAGPRSVRTPQNAVLEIEIYTTYIQGQAKL